MVIRSFPRTVALLVARILAFLALVVLAMGFLMPVLRNARERLLAPSDFDTLALGSIAALAAALAATVLCMKFFERLRWVDVGLWWRPATQWNLAAGLFAGLVSAGVATVVPVLFGAGEFLPVTSSNADLPQLIYFLVVIAIAAAGEELQFRGYLFQVLVRATGIIPALLITGALFGMLHLGNPGSSRLGTLNTVLAGVVLGYAFWRSRDLWLPIGAHIGWNCVFPLVGDELSGIGVHLTGYRIFWKSAALWHGGSYGPEAGLYGTAGLLAMLVLVRRLPVKRQDAPLLESGATPL